MKQEQQYNGWLVSNNLIKRSIAVWGHFILGYFIIILIVSIPVMIIISLWA